MKLQELSARQVACK